MVSFKRLLYDWNLLIAADKNELNVSSFFHEIIKLFKFALTPQSFWNSKSPNWTFLKGTFWFLGEYSSVNLLNGTPRSGVMVSLLNKIVVTCWPSITWHLLFIYTYISRKSDLWRINLGESYDSFDFNHWFHLANTTGNIPIFLLIFTLIIHALFDGQPAGRPFFIDRNAWWITIPPKHTLLPVNKSSHIPSYRNTSVIGGGGVSKELSTQMLQVIFRGNHMSLRKDIAGIK